MEEEKINFEKRSKKNIFFNVIMVLIIFAICTLCFNWYYAIGYMLILLIHESGHYVASKILKVNVKFGNVTPLGAYIVHDKTKSIKEEAIIAISGPLFGAVLALIYFIMYIMFKDNTFYILSVISISINLFNLIPIMPFDGGYVVTAVSYKICYIGIPILIYFIVKIKRLKSKIFMGIFLISSIFKIVELRKTYYKENYFSVCKKDKLKIGASYISLVLILVISMVYLYKYYNFNKMFYSIFRFKKA